ncbi:MAG: hypothetical protein QF903_04950 [Planctomycetota bacterium]|nr:hypothetical protein [Planctomycetota bacterium]MDP6761870.1 hypothetical protein [Planctomycetota bacterium]MDP6988805.1 hypothetical protein [Planctomycetota bacterium]
MSARVSKITLAPPPQEPPVLPGPALSPRASWFLPPLFLAATAAGVALVLRGPDALFGWALAAVFGTGFAWLGISIFFPPTVDRSCPRCGEEALERLDPEATHGIRCTRCGLRDETLSSFLLAEEEGPLEDIVMAERGRRPRRTRVRSDATGASR